VLTGVAHPASATFYQAPSPEGIWFGISFKRDWRGDRYLFTAPLPMVRRLAATVVLPEVVTALSRSAISRKGEARTRGPGPCTPSSSSCSSAIFSQVSAGARPARRHRPTHQAGRWVTGMIRPSLEQFGAQPAGGARTPLAIRTHDARASGADPWPRAAAAAKPAVQPPLLDELW